MSTPEPEITDSRRKRTIWLLAIGGASLVLPLLGVVYIRMSEAKTARAPDSSVMFDRRERGETKINVSQTAAPQAMPGSGASSLPVPGAATAAPAPGSGSSLDFVKGGANNTYFQDKPAAPAASTAPAAAAAAPAAAPPEPEPAKTVAKKGGKKPFVMPKLQGAKSFSSFKSASSPKPTGGQGLSGVADPQAGKGGGDMADMLKNVPGGASNPELQKYLKSQGK